MKDQEYDYFYDDINSEYCYKGTNVLKNKLGIRDLDTLYQAERDFTSVRQVELSNNKIIGDFTLKHLCSIHQQLFQDVYIWAGKIRTVDIAKGTLFCLNQYIESQFNQLYFQLEKDTFLKNISDKKEMSIKLAYYLGEINMIHPFREGNGRTQRIYIEQICINNGKFEIDFTGITKDEMIEACLSSANGDNKSLERLVYKCLKDSNENPQ